MPRQGLRRPLPHTAAPLVPHYQDGAEPEDVYEEEVEVVQPAQFVRVATHQVGPYPKDSVLPAAHFEQLERLLGLGSLVYDYNAIVTSITSPGILQTAGAGASPGTLSGAPRAPWLASTPEEILGHMAMLTSAPTSQIYQADQNPAPRRISNTTEHPMAAINTAEHAVTNDIDVTPNG